MTRSPPRTLAANETRRGATPLAGVARSETVGTGLTTSAVELELTSSPAGSVTRTNTAVEPAPVGVQFSALAFADTQPAGRSIHAIVRGPSPPPATSESAVVPIDIEGGRRRRDHGHFNVGDPPRIVERARSRATDEEERAAGSGRDQAA